MSTAGIIVSLVLFAGFVIWLALPFFASSDVIEMAVTSMERQRERLQVYYERVLRNLHDLDEDYATGKLNEQEYRIEREQWAQRGIQALKAIDKLDDQHLMAPVDADDAIIDEAINCVIEDAITGEADLDKSVSL